MTYAHEAAEMANHHPFKAVGWLKQCPAVLRANIAANEAIYEDSLAHVAVALAQWPADGSKRPPTDDEAVSLGKASAAKGKLQAATYILNDILHQG